MYIRCESHMNITSSRFAKSDSRVFSAPAAAHSTVTAYRLDAIKSKTLRLSLLPKTWEPVNQLWWFNDEIGVIVKDFPLSLSLNLFYLCNGPDTSMISSGFNLIF